MKEFTFSTDGKTLLKQIEQLGIVVKTVMKNSHITACGVIIHSLLHGDITLIQRIDDAMGGGTHRSGFRKFIEAEAPVIWEKADKKGGKLAGWAFDKAKYAKLRAKYDADPASYTAKLLEKTWFERNPDKAFEQFVFADKFQAFIAQAMRKSTGKDGALHDIPADQLAVAKAAVDRITAMQKARKPLLLAAPVH